MPLDGDEFEAVAPAHPVAAWNEPEVEMVGGGAYAMVIDHTGALKSRFPARPHR